MTAVTSPVQVRTGPRRRRRLLLVANWLHDVGGVQTATRELGAAFSADGWLVRYASVLPPLSAGAERHGVRTLFPGVAPSVLLRRRLGRRITGTKAARLDPVGMRLAGRRLARIARDADAVVAMDVLAGQLLAGLPGGPSRYLQFHNTIGSLTDTRDLDRILAMAGRLTGVVALTERDAAGFRAAGCPAVTAIGNAVSMPAPPADAPRERLVVGLGRYTGPKHFSLLLDAWSELPRALRTTWRLELHGEGPEERALREQAEHDDSVTIHPPSDDVLGLLRRATLLALPSDFEGLPMVLLEAMTQGAGCVATASSPGVTDLLGAAGWLSPVGDRAALTAALMEAMTNPAVRADRIATAAERVGAFAPAAIRTRWLELLREPAR